MLGYWIPQIFTKFHILLFYNHQCLEKNFESTMKLDVRFDFGDKIKILFEYFQITLKQIIKKHCLSSQSFNYCCNYLLNEDKICQTKICHKIPKIFFHFISLVLRILKWQKIKKKIRASCAFYYNDSSFSTRFLCTR